MLSCLPWGARATLGEPAESLANCCCSCSSHWLGLLSAPSEAPYSWKGGSAAECGLGPFWGRLPGLDWPGGCLFWTYLHSWTNRWRVFLATSPLPCWVP